MKLRNLIAAVMLVLVATAGAFATAKTTKFISVFYISSTGECLPGEVDATCPFINVPDCSAFVTPAVGAPLTTQIYASQVFNPDTQRLECEDPYSETQP